jgi:hypothetical protein
LFVVAAAGKLAIAALPVSNERSRNRAFSIQSDINHHAAWSTSGVSDEPSGLDRRRSLGQFGAIAPLCAAEPE